MHEMLWDSHHEYDFKHFRMLFFELVYVYDYKDILCDIE
jgi:hypothetical protein